MKSIGRGIKAHVGEPILEPERELVPADGDETAIVSGRLEHRSPPTAVILAVNTDQLEDGLHRTQLWMPGGSQGNLVHTLPELIVLRLGDSKNDALPNVVVEGLDPVPAEHHVQIDLRGGPDQVTAP